MIVVDFDRDLDLDLAHARTLAHAHDLDLALFLALARNFVRDFALVRKLARDFTLALTLARATKQFNSEFAHQLEQLRRQLPDLKNPEAFRALWKEQDNTWIANLRAAMVEHRNIGHNWQFTEIQREKLRQYYMANLLLMECLNSDCYVTKTTRQAIEETLLLPISKLEPLPESAD